MIESQLETTARSAGVKNLRLATQFKNDYDPEFEDFTDLRLTKTQNHPLYSVLPRMHVDYQLSMAPNPMTVDTKKIPPLDPAVQGGLFDYILGRYYEAASGTYTKEAQNGKNHDAAFGIALKPLDELGGHLAKAMGTKRFPDNFVAPPDLLTAVASYFKIQEDVAKQTDTPP